VAEAQYAFTQKQYIERYETNNTIKYNTIQNTKGISRRDVLVVVICWNAYRPINQDVQA